MKGSYPLKRAFENQGLAEQPVGLLLEFKVQRGALHLPARFVA